MPQRTCPSAHKPLGVLIIHSDVEQRRQLGSSLEKADCEVSYAEGRTDGLPLLYQAKPDLIFLEVQSDREESWETFSRIRIFTDTPAVLLADRMPSSTHRAQCDTNTLIVLPPVSIPKVIVKARALCRSSNPSEPGSAEGADGEELMIQLQMLQVHEVLAIDRALEEIGDLGEVRLTIRRGRLRFLAKLKTVILIPDAVTSYSD